MSVSSEVQRTLVKSPPELWAELSDPAALARHLGELGEIRIVRTVPETTVEWEAAEVAGRVHIKPSAWGTKVTLSVTGELRRPGPGRYRSGPDHEPESEHTPESQDQKPESEHAPESEGHKPLSERAPESEDHKPVSERDEPESEGDRPESEGQSQSIPVIPVSAQLGSLDPAGSGSQPASTRSIGPEFISDVPSVRADAADAQPPTTASESGRATQPQPVPGSEAPRGSEPRVSSRRRLFARAWRRLLRGRPAEDASAATEETSHSDEDLLVSRPTASQTIEPAPATSTADSAAQTDDPEPPGPVAAAPQPLATEQPATASVEPPANVAAERPENSSAGLDGTGEDAAEELTAVLVSVLDRLGAAHHRPFSRA
jgi:hypothetical protein